MPRRGLDLPVTCIIGAGSSGITAAKALSDRDLPFDCFEKGERPGGTWVFGNSNGMSSIYRHLHSNTSRDRMQYADYPMPRDFPHFPHHSQVARYFEDYVDHFGLRDRITFNVGVGHAERLPDGVWQITLDTGETRRYDALVVANGHHWAPRLPDPPFPGRFAGIELHAHQYVDNTIFEGKRVVVLGMGNSAMDIAVEASHVADSVWLAARRGQHILPKLVLGRPIDQVCASRYTALVPWRVRSWIFDALLAVTVGSVERYGLPAPRQSVGRTEVAVSSRVLDRVVHGAIVAKPNIAELAGEHVRFVDGSVEAVDVVVYCTGYRIVLPFFDEQFIAVANNEIRLFRNLFMPGIDNLFFVGLLQPLGAHMPLAEIQGRWVAHYLRGEYALPAPDRLNARIDRDLSKMRRRFVASARHTIQVDRDDYPFFAAREIRRGRRRARRAGYALPVPPRAGRIAREPDPALPSGSR